MSNTFNWEHIIQSIKDAETKLHGIYDELGITEEYKNMYDKQAHSHIIELLNDMVSEWEQRKQALLSEIQEMIKEATVLCKELETEDITKGYENLPLREVEQKLKSQLKNLINIKEQRLAYFQELKTQEYAICTKLGVKTMELNSAIPSEKELEQFKLYINGIEAEKKRAENTANELRHSIIKNMDLLGLQPTTTFEDLVVNYYEDFVYTTNNFSSLRLLKNKLEAEAEEAKEKVDAMKRDLIALWKHLDEPEDACKLFLKSNDGVTVNDINALKAEIKRCKVKRMENIAKYVNKVRDEISDLWDACKFNEEQKKQFRAYNAHTFTEDLLTLHELEAERLRKFYDDNRVIFEVLNERDTLWLKMKELQQRADDPDRFHNRGGQLLAEERERKVIQKKLPKIEQRLHELVAEFESRTGETFTVYGLPLDEFLMQSWESYKSEKETMKKARKEAKESNKSVRKTPLSTSKKLHSVSTRNVSFGASKRKLPFDPSPNKSAKRRIVSAEKNHPTLCASKIRRSGKVSRRLLNRSANKSGKKKRSITDPANSTATNTTYGQFEEHLEQRDELRSSLLPENVMSLANTTTRTQTPAKPLRRNLITLSTPKVTPRTPGKQILRNTSTATTPTTSSRTPNVVQKSPRSPRNLQSRRLVTAPNNLPIIF